MSDPLRTVDIQEPVSVFKAGNSKPIGSVAVIASGRSISEGAKNLHGSEISLDSFGSALRLIGEASR